MTFKSRNTTETIASALEGAGLASDECEAAPSPYTAAEEAFYVWNGSRDANAWDELRRWFSGPSVPRIAYHRKLSAICLRALRHADLPAILVEPISYARGYFDARVEVAAPALGGDDE